MTELTNGLALVDGDLYDWQETGFLLQGSKLEVQQNGLLGVGAVGLVGCILGLWPTLLGVLCLMGWSAVEAAELAWEYWKVHSEPGVLYLGECSRSLRGCTPQDCACRRVTLQAPSVLT